MGPKGNFSLFDDESPPVNNLDNTISQFSLGAELNIKVRNVSNKIQINLKLLIRFIRKKGKMQVQLVIEEYMVLMASFFIHSFCYNYTALFFNGKTEPNIISYFSWFNWKEGNYNIIKSNNFEQFDMAASKILNVLETAGV
jgi:hypothetical protein